MNILIAYSCIAFFSVVVGGSLLILYIIEHSDGWRDE